VPIQNYDLFYFIAEIANDHEFLDCGNRIKRQDVTAVVKENIFDPFI